MHWKHACFWTLFSERWRAPPWYDTHKPIVLLGCPERHLNSVLQEPHLRAGESDKLSIRIMSSFQRHQLGEQQLVGLVATAGQCF